MQLAPVRHASPVAYLQVVVFMLKDPGFKIPQLHLLHISVQVLVLNVDLVGTLHRSTRKARTAGATVLDNMLPSDTTGSSRAGAVTPVAHKATEQAKHASSTPTPTC